MKSDKFSLLKNIRINKDVKNLITGAVLAKILPLIFLPIFSRIYSPEDFGVASLFTGIVVILSTMANGRYELAIGLPKEKNEAVNIMALSFFIALIFSSLILILILFFGNEILNIINAEILKEWIYLIPLAIFLNGIFNILNYANNRLGAFREIAKCNMEKAALSVAVQTALGVFSKGPAGIIWANIVSQFLGNRRLYINLRNNFNLNDVRKSEIIRLANRYQSFPKFSMWAGVFNALSNNMLIFFVPAVFGVAVLGMYSVAQRILAAPIALISSSIAQVFLQQATLEYQKDGNANFSFNKTVRILFLIGAPVFSAIYFFADMAFALLLGERWRIAGVYASAMAPLLFTRFVVSSVSMMNVIFEKNKIGFYWQLGLIGLNFSIIALAFAADWSFLKYLKVSSLLLSMHYLLLLFIMSNYESERKP